MLERFGKWFDSLWENNSHDGTNDSLSHKVITETTTKCYYDTIVAKLNNDSDNIVILTLTPDTDESRKTSLAFRMINYRVFMTALGTGFNEEGTESSNPIDKLSFYRWFNPMTAPDSKVTVTTEVKSYQNDIVPRIAELAKDSLSKSKPHTLNHTCHGMYVTGITEDDKVQWFNSTQSSIGVSRVWTFDVKLWYKNDNDNKSNWPRFIILDHTKVAHKLLPHTHWRRWVNITELEDSKTPWVVRYVPRNIAEGKIRYFNVEINFDAVGLGGVSFDVASMLFQAYCKIQNECDHKLPENRWQVHQEFSHELPTRSDLYFNYDNMTVKHRDVKLSIKGYIKCQVKPVFHDNNPFLNPAVGKVIYNGHVFQFDEDFKIRDFHLRNITGDQWPDAK